MSNYRIVEHTIPCQYVREYPRALANSQEDTPQLAVKQYIPKNNPIPQPGDVTIIGGHACAFPKEMYEPLWDDLLSRAQKQGWRIRSIWIADVSQQGQSAVINEGLLGNDPNWIDHSRDLLHMINLKRDEMPRPLIGIGHSMGGCQLVNLAFIHPRLLTTLVLIDPVIQPTSAELKDKHDPSKPSLARLSTYRRTVWSSPEAVDTAVRKAAFSSSWDPRVTALWIEHGHRSTPTLLEPDASPPQMTLKTPPAHEVHTFLRANYSGTGSNSSPLDRTTHPDLNPSLPFTSPFYRAEPPATYNRLPELRPSTLYIFGSTSDVSPPALSASKVERTGTGVGGSGGAKEGRVKGVTFEGVGHLIAMEAVEKTADEIAEWVGTEMQRWRQEEKVWETWAKTKTLKEKQEITEEWKKNIGSLPPRVKKAVGDSKI